MFGLFSHRNKKIFTATAIAFESVNAQENHDKGAKGMEDTVLLGCYIALGVIGLCACAAIIYLRHERQQEINNQNNYRQLQRITV